MPVMADVLLRTVDGAFAVDAKERIVFWSPACEQLLKLPAREALGRRCCDVVRGCNTRNEPLCGPTCRVAELARGGAPVPPFSMSLHDHGQEKMSVTVTIMLVPGTSASEWGVMHLLHRAPVTPGLGLWSGGADASRRECKTTRRGARSGAHNTSPLTSREQDIIELLAEGLSAAVISTRLRISPVTVRNHIQRIMAKLGLHSQAETVAYAYRHNLV